MSNLMGYCDVGDRSGQLAYEVGRGNMSTKGYLDLCVPHFPSKVKK